MSILKRECQRGVLNFMLLSEYLVKPEDAIGYCEDITAKYLLKYFPYQCQCCHRFSSHILVVKCSANDDISCDSQICLTCALELFEFLESNNKMIEECGFCGRFLGGRSKAKRHATGMCFSNIKECDEEQEQDTEEDDMRSKGSDQNQIEFQHSSPDIDTEGDESVAREASSRSEQNLDGREFETLVIRDANQQELAHFKEQMKEHLKQLSDCKQATKPVPAAYNRCSLINMTPRGIDVPDCEMDYGQESMRSSHLSGIKPKAL